MTTQKWPVYPHDALVDNQNANLVSNSWLLKLKVVPKLIGPFLTINLKVSSVNTHKAMISYIAF